jgi:hypothetical protein
MVSHEYPWLTVMSTSTVKADPSLAGVRHFKLESFSSKVASTILVPKIHLYNLTSKYMGTKDAILINICVLPEKKIAKKKKKSANILQETKRKNLT